MATDPPRRPDPARISPADLLPPADVSVRRQRRAQREAAEREASGRGGGRRGGRGRHRRTWPQVLLLGVMVLGVVAAAGGAAVTSLGLEKLDRIERVGVALSSSPPGEPENVLVVGSDTRDTIEGSGLDTAGFTGDEAEGSGQRSDTILVVRVDPRDESVDVLSLPRDLWLPIAGAGSSQRINTAYAGGPQRLIDTIELNFGIPIHHYVEVDFAGFAGLVDAIGGVPMWFDTPMRDDHSGLLVGSSGCHVLDPEAALAFARSRHVEYYEDGRWSVDPTGDLGRITRQQVFIRRAVDKVGDLGITDAVTLNRVLDVAVDNVTVDRAFGLDDMLDLGRRFGDIGGDGLRTHALPVYDFRTSGGAAVLGVEESDAQPILNLFRGVPAGTIYPSSVEQLTVLNGTGVAGQAGSVADALEVVGFEVDAVGDVGDVVDVDVETVARTRIRYAPGAERQADLVRRHLTAGALLVADEDLDDGEVVLETGTDLTTIGRRPFPIEDPIPTTTTIGSSSPTTTAPATTTTTAPIGVAPDPAASC